MSRANLESRREVGDPPQVPRGLGFSYNSGSPVGSRLGLSVTRGGGGLSFAFRVHRRFNPIALGD